jgi:hypothetical protein
MMHIYRSTRGVSECSVKGEASFRLVEMGGRSLTTLKLLHFFDNANAVIFIASCSDVERRLVRYSHSTGGLVGGGGGGGGAGGEGRGGGGSASSGNNDGGGGGDKGGCCRRGGGGRGGSTSGSISSNSSAGSVGGGGAATGTGRNAIVFTSGFEETADLFSLVAKDSALSKLPIILLITKLDVLMDKITNHHLDLPAAFGSEFKGDPTEVKDVQKHVVDVFRKKCGASRPFYHHFMNCTEQESVHDVFVEIKRDIRDSLLRKLLPQ